MALLLRQLIGAVAARYLLWGNTRERWWTPAGQMECSYGGREGTESCVGRVCASHEEQLPDGCEKVLDHHPASKEKEVPQDVVDQWKEYFEDLLTPTGAPSFKELGPEDLGLGSLTSGAEITEVVKKHLGGEEPGADEICPAFLKTLDVPELSWLT